MKPAQHRDRTALFIHYEVPAFFNEQFDRPEERLFDLVESGGTPTILQKIDINNKVSRQYLDRQVRF
jgi:hypothetical protein